MRLADTARLPFRPRPMNGESFRGFMLRLASSYRHESIESFASTQMGFTLPESATPASLAGDKFIKRLAKALAMGADELEDAFRASSSTIPANSKRPVFSDITIRPPRLCPLCIQDGVLQADWQIAHRLHCPKHRVFLVDVCPDCQKPLTWSAKLLSGCPKCNHLWQDSCTDPVGDRGIPFPNANDANAIYEAYMVLAIPGTIEVWERQTFPYDPHHHRERMLLAYGSVYSRRINALVLDALSSRIGEGPAYSRRRLHLRELFSSLVSDTRQPFMLELDEENVLPLTMQKNALPTRVVKAMTRSDKPADICSAKSVAAVLGMRTQQVNLLVDEANLPVLKHTPINRDRLFSLRLLADFLSGLRSASTKLERDGTVTLWQADSISQAFGLQFAILVKWCAQGTVEFELGEDLPLTEIRLSRASLIARCELEFYHDKTGVYSRKQLLKLLRVSDEALDYVSRQGWLPCKGWSALGSEFTKPDVLDFLSRFKIARREALLKGGSVEEAWTQMGKSLFPVFESGANGRLIGIARNHQ